MTSDPIAAAAAQYERELDQLAQVIRLQRELEEQYLAETGEEWSGHSIDPAGAFEAVSRLYEEAVEREAQEQQE